MAMAKMRSEWGIAGTLAAVVANATPGRKGRVLKPDDFMPPSLQTFKRSSGGATEVSAADLYLMFKK